MKKTIVLAFVAILSVFTLASCNKNVDLTGTTWEGSIKKDTVMIDGTPAEFSMTMTVDFTTDATGRLSAANMIAIDGTPYMNHSFDESFSYTFDGESSGSLYNLDLEEDEQFSIPFTYDKKNKQITIKQEDYTLDLHESK